MELIEKLDQIVNLKNEIKNLKEAETKLINDHSHQLTLERQSFDSQLTALSSELSSLKSQLSQTSQDLLSLQHSSTSHSSQLQEDYENMRNSHDAKA